MTQCTVRIGSLMIFTSSDIRRTVHNSIVGVSAQNQLDSVDGAHFLPMHHKSKPPVTVI
ncbi:MAG: hypothetical protein ACOX1N_03380 [Candidatus Methanomethylophilaceae archaeon]